MKALGWLALIFLIAASAVVFRFRDDQVVSARKTSEKPPFAAPMLPITPVDMPAPAPIAGAHQEPLRKPTPSSDLPAPPSGTKTSMASGTPGLHVPMEDTRLRDAKGNYHFSGMEEAIKACETRHMRLPSIRELANIARAHGAKGILETRDKRDQDETQGYKLVQALTADGKLDEFYYNPEGYSDSILADIGKYNLLGLPSVDGEIGKVHSPGDPVERLYYWSSSESLGHHNEADPDLRSFYVLDIYGKIHDHYRTVVGLSRCVTP